MTDPLDDETAAALWAAGAEKLREVYADRVPVLPEGSFPFTDVMLRTIFAQVWTRDGLDQRDRRLLLMGVIAAMGEADTFAVQVRAALDHGELTPDQLRESLILLAPYAGYPRVSALIAPVEAAIAAWEEETADG